MKPARYRTKRETMRMYIIVAINERTGRRYDTGFSPMSHREACIVLTKFTPYKWRRLRLEECTA